MGADAATIEQAAHPEAVPVSEPTADPAAEPAESADVRRRAQGRGPFAIVRPTRPDGHALAATIADVARLAGVSTATVSRVLAGLGGARPATRERVLAAARELGYRPSGVARSLKLRPTRTLGLIVTDIENPFFPELVRAVEDAARDLGYALLLCNAADDPEREGAYLDLLVERRVDGVVIAASSLGRRHREWLAAAPLPIVLVNCVAPGIPLPSVAVRQPGRGARWRANTCSRWATAVSASSPPRPATSTPRTGSPGCAMRWRTPAQDGAGLPWSTGDAGVAGGERAMRELLAEAPEVTASSPTTT